jgi:DNA-binding beta-propeller fold protein YncE
MVRALHTWTVPPVTAVAILWALSLLAPAPADALQVTGLKDPESFLVDPSTGQYFISNVNGSPEAKDNNGFITKLDKTGKVEQLQFIRGGDRDVVLHAPKGMAIGGQILYVADLDVLRGFDKNTGRPVVSVSLAGQPARNGRAPALSDVASDGQGLLYVSDTGTDTIYRIDASRQHAVTVLAHDSSLAEPRGLAVHPKTGRVIVVSWKNGTVLEISPQGTVTELVSNGFFSSRFRNLDGVDFDNWGNLYVSDFTAGKIWRMRWHDRHFDVIAEYLPTPADIGVDRENHLILVPYLYGNAAEINGLERPRGSGEKKQKRTLADYGFTMPGTGKPEEKKDELKAK